MSLITSENAKTQSQVMGAALNTDGDAENIGIVLMPQHTYKKGQLWRLEGTALQLFKQANCNTDRTVAASFEVCQDPRDERPMIYTIRIMSPIRNTPTKPKFMSKQSLWSTSSLLLSGLVADIPRIKTKDMVEIECLGENALPTDIELDTHMSQSEKYQQLGSNAVR